MNVRVRELLFSVLPSLVFIITCFRLWAGGKGKFRLCVKAGERTFATCYDFYVNSLCVTEVLIYGFL